jgi:hypothetical protein
MYFFDPEIEQAALKAFHEDPLTEESDAYYSNDDSFDENN